MKKVLLTVSIVFVAVCASQAQIIPNLQFGVKGGVNLTSLSKGSGSLESGNRAGYLAGIWARVGALGFNFQPELYITQKNVDVNIDGLNTYRAKFTSIDVPLLVGTKVGAFGFGGRFYAGPLLSFAVNKDGNPARVNFKDSNLALAAGVGLDVRKFSVDLRYELGVNRLDYMYGEKAYKTRVSLFSLSLGYAFL